MKVHLNQIPTDGLHIEGEDDGAILEIQDPLIKPAGPIRYALDVGISGKSFFATGVLEAPIEFCCVNCLQTFLRTFVIRHFGVQTDLDGPETIDLTPYAREDILLAFPSHPHCDWDGKTQCPGAHHVPGQDDSESGQPQAAWGALDQLKL